MTPLEILEFIKNDPITKRSDGSFNNNLARKSYAEKKGGSIKRFYDSVMRLTEWSNALKPTFTTRLKIIEKGITERPNCYCGNPLKFNWEYDSPDPFNTYCSTKCSRNCPDVKKKQVETCIERYGVTNPFMNEDIKKKIVEKNTTLTFDIVVERAKSNYGDRFNYKDLGKGSKPNWVEVYCIKHDHTFAPRIRDLMRGVTNCPKCRSDNLSKKYTLSREDVVSNLFEIKGNQITLIGEYTGMHDLTEFKCKDHGPFKTRPYQMFQDQNCPKCFNKVSKQEKEVASFISELTGKSPLSNCRRTLGNGKEVDIVCEKSKVMFEYNGLYWHSFEKTLDKRYHLNKTEQAESLGYQLYHIWSHEWSNETKQEIWKSIIANALGHSNKIYARKCQIVELSPKEYKHFMFENHLQGEGSMAKYRYGLMHEGELVSAMSFSSPRFTKDYDFELVRFVNKKGHTVVGGASKLFKHFSSNVGKGCSIISYADRRISQGNLYKNLGFEFSHHTDPGYFYTKDFVRTLSRYQCQKHKLADLLDDFDSSKTEYENMFANKYYTIFDCGNSVWVWNR